MQFVTRTSSANVHSRRTAELLEQAHPQARIQSVCRDRASRCKPRNTRTINGIHLDAHCDEVAMLIAVGQQWGIFSRKAQRWAVATVVSVENGTVNLKYRDYPGFCHLEAVNMLQLSDDLQFLEPLEEITPLRL